MKTEKKAAHTPGPWEWTDILWAAKGHVYVGRPSDFNDWNGKPKVEVVATCEGKDAISNARLIAAAPELLEALKMLRAAFASFSAECNPSGKSSGVADWKLINEAEVKTSSAIAKAEGRP